MIWSNRDLVARLAATALLPGAGYRLASSGRPKDAQAIETRVRSEVGRVLGDAPLAKAAGERFVGSLACDDLDALTSVVWPRSMRLRRFVVEGFENLPRKGPVILASFHLGGGFRVFDALMQHGLRPAFLRQPFAGSPSAYERTIEAARGRYFHQHLGEQLIAVGPQARERLQEHLEAGGAAVALLDVAPASLGLRDRATVSFLGREIELAVGLMRLASSMQIPVVVYDGRIDRWQRVLRFHPAHRAAQPEALLSATIRTLENVIRERPWDWQGWLDLDNFFAAAEVQ